MLAAEKKKKYTDADYMLLRQKTNLYEKYGVKEYIIIDPLIESAELHFLKDGVYCIHQKAEKNEKLHSLLLPGLSFDLIKLFS